MVRAACSPCLVGGETTDDASYIDRPVQPTTDPPPPNQVASLTVTFINWARAKFHHEGLWLTSTVVVACTVGALLPSAMRGIKFQGIPSFYMRYLSLCAILVVVAAWQGK